MRYLGLSLCLGFAATWASENLFWFIPPPDITLTGWLLTWGAYSTAAACALSFVLWSGAGGWATAFLGGAVLGYLVEGVIVGTMYDAFPVQLVWTPLAWHALITGGVVIGLGLAPMPPIRRLALWLCVGAAASVWGLYWPMERGAVPGSGALLMYLALPGFGVALALWAVGRIGRPDPPRWVLWIAPILALCVALAQAASVPTPLRLALPVMLGVVWLALRRAGPAGWAAPVPLPHHLTVLAAPVLAALTAPVLWATVGSAHVAQSVAITTGAVSVALLIRVFLRRSPRATV